jgi:hypothetical protein
LNGSNDVDANKGVVRLEQGEALLQSFLLIVPPRHQSKDWQSARRYHKSVANF